MPRLRSTVAALMLLAPVAAPWLVQPASAATAAAATAPAITNVTINSDAGLTPGATLRLQVQATQGGRSASVALGDSGVTVPLAQQSPGVYTGTYVVRRKDQIDPTQMMTARVTLGERTATRQFHFPPAFQALAKDGDAARETQAARRDDRDDRRVAARPPERDERFPQITELQPANGERLGPRGRAEVGARLSDEGTGVDPSSVRLRLNGRDVTSEARVSPDGVRFRGDLEPGRYAAEVSVRDQAGNRTTKTWGFDVAAGPDRRDDDRYGGNGPLPLAVTSHRDRALVDPEDNLAIEGRTVPFANVRVQVEAAGRGQPDGPRTIADQTVQADRDGNFAVLVRPRELPGPGTRYDVRLRASSGNQATEEHLTLLPRQG